MTARRTFLYGLAGSLGTLPARAQSQPAARPFVIGYITQTTEAWHVPWRQAFDESLRSLGYEEGRNVVVHRRYGRGDLSALPALVAELVKLEPHVIVASNNAEIALCMQATRTIPIVSVLSADPVGAGFVRSLARPGTNVTGLSSSVGPEILGKRLELLREVAPSIRRVAVLRVASDRRSHMYGALEDAAAKLSLTLEIVEASSSSEVERALATLSERRPDGLYLDGPSSVLHMQRLCDFALANRLPSTYIIREFARAGMLITYGANLRDLYRRAAIHVDKILRGAMPGDLPVEQPTRFELAVNLKTARAIGVKVPQSILVRADEVFE
jgi:putative ABC transport system substrate-binding protein